MLWFDGCRSLYCLIFLLPRSIRTHNGTFGDNSASCLECYETHGGSIVGNPPTWFWTQNWINISRLYYSFLFVVFKRTVFLRMFAFPLLLVRPLRLGSLSCLFLWPPKPWHSDEHQGSRWMSIPLKCGIIGLISKSSASASVCAQTVSPCFNVTCKCDLAPKTSHGKTQAAPPFTIHLHNACSLAHVERTSFWVDSHPRK